MRTICYLWMCFWLKEYLRDDVEDLEVAECLPDMMKAADHGTIELTCRIQPTRGQMGKIQQVGGGTD
jgi:hypothetical protein